MKDEEKISIIIPTYNREKTIIDSINSVLKQTYKNLELIIVDDGSTDNTKKIVSKIKDNRIKYIKLKTNSGACIARNTGITSATGKYISFQDSDDIFHTDKLEKQYKNLTKNNSDIDFCKIIINDGSNKEIIPRIDTEKSIENNKILDELCKGNFISTQAILIKKEVIQKYLFDPNLPRLQDFDLVLRVLPDVNVSYTKETLVIRKGKLRCGEDLRRFSF